MAGSPPRYQCGVIPWLCGASVGRFRWWKSRVRCRDFDGAAGKSTLSMPSTPCVHHFCIILYTSPEQRSGGGLCDGGWCGIPQLFLTQLEKNWNLDRSLVIW